jgi:TetR/AcrR family transcriptional regulator
LDDIVDVRPGVVQVDETVDSLYLHGTSGQFGREAGMKLESDRVRDPEGTRAAVLDAAERLFAEEGFAATSMRDISSASGVSHPLIHHHFGSKESLYAAVKRRLKEGYARRFPRAARAVNRPLSVRAEMRRIMAFLGGSPMLLRLALRTRLDRDKQVWPGEPDMLDTLRRRIKVSQDRGLIRDDLDPAHLSLMMLGLVMFWVENRDHFSECLGVDVKEEDFLRQAIALIERGVSPDVNRSSTVLRRPIDASLIEPGRQQEESREQHERD